MDSALTQTPVEYRNRDRFSATLIARLDARDPQRLTKMQQAGTLEAALQERVPQVEDRYAAMVNGGTDPSDALTLACQMFDL